MTSEHGGSTTGLPLDARTAERFFEVTTELLALLDGAGVILVANPALGRCVGLVPEEMGGQRLVDVLPPANPTQIANALTQLRAGSPSAHFEMQSNVGAGVVSLSVGLHRGEAEGGFYFAARDVSDRQRLIEQLESRGARKDHLGLLGNRSGFEDALQLERKMSPSLGVVVVTFADLGSVTETHGAQVTTELLQAAIARLRRNLRDTDLVARMREDQFGILLSGPDVTGSAERLGAQLVETMLRAFGIKGRVIDVLVGVGVATTGAPIDDGDWLLPNAEAAARRALESGETSCVIHGGGGPAKPAPSRVASMASPSSSAPDAFDPDGMAVHVRGIFPATGRGAMGVEALLVRREPAMERLARATQESVEPIEAITGPAATETIDRIGGWIGAHASRRLCINLAPEQAGDQKLLAAIARAANSRSLDPRQIVCELPETVITSGAAARELVRDIRHHGFLVAVDRFGDDSASIGKLRDLDISYIKLDPALVRDMFTSDFHSALISSAVEVARAMNMAVIATGVATEQHLDAVRKLGVSFVQGAFVHAPEELALFVARLG